MYSIVYDTWILTRGRLNFLRLRAIFTPGSFPTVLNTQNFVKIASGQQWTWLLVILILRSIIFAPNRWKYFLLGSSLTNEFYRTGGAGHEGEQGRGGGRGPEFRCGEGGQGVRRRIEWFSEYFIKSRHFYIICSLAAKKLRHNLDQTRQKSTFGEKTIL